MKVLKPKRKFAISLALLIGLTMAFVQNAYAYIQATDNPPGTAGSFGALDQIVGGDQFLISSTTDNSLKPYNSIWDWYKYAPDTVNVDYAGGGSNSGGIWHFDHIHDKNGSITANNGYLMIGPSSLDQWVQALHGDSSYATDPSRLYKTIFKDSSNNATFTVINLGQLELECGASFAPGNSINSHGATIWATDQPTAQITLPLGSSVQQGTKLLFNAIANIEEYHSNYHYEFVDVVGSDGKNYSGAVGPLSGAVSGSQSLTVQTQSGQKTMQEVNGGGNDTSYPPTPHTWINGKDGSAGYNSPNYIDSTYLPNGTYTIYLYVKDYFNRAAAVQTTTFTVTGGSINPPPPPPGGGPCPPPPAIPQKPANYVESQSWSCNGNGSETLTWTDSNWVLQTTTSTDSNGCTITNYQWVDQPLTYSHTYPATVGNLAVTGLFYDPGQPSNMWYPWHQSGTQRNNDAYSNGSTIGGAALPTYGNPSAQPAVYVRVGGGFAFRMMWYGTPHSMPTGGTATYTLKNPDGSYQSWTKSFSMLSATEVNSGTNIDPDAGASGYPQPASEYGYAYTAVPKYATSPTLEMAKWNLDGNSATAAKVSVSLQVNNGCGSVMWNDPFLAQTFSYPVWYFIHEVPNSTDQYLVPQENYGNNVITR